MGKTTRASGFISQVLWVCFCFVLFVEIQGASVDTERRIVPSDILKVMEQDFSGSNSKDAFQRSRFFIPSNNLGRKTMQDFLEYKFSSILAIAGGKKDGHILYERPFTTSVKIGTTRPTVVDGINYLALLSPKQNDTENDQPLIILANYDTDNANNALNPTEENGSGVAALLVIGAQLAADIHSGTIELKHSVILAAVDASLQKYASDGTEVNATTGSDDVANKFLPEFLAHRPKGIRGVIVLDNLMNYQSEKSTQHIVGWDRAYPNAYQEISNGNFAGDFLALVARGDDLDRPLVSAIEEQWKKPIIQPRSENEGGSEEDGKNIPSSNPRLIKFIHEVRNAQSEGYFHFLKSDQSSFWNHKSDVPPYPAILLTDTRNYRTPVCPVDPVGYCDSSKETTSPKNLDFAHRTILTVYETIIRLQSGGASRLSSILTFVPILLVTVRHFLL